MSSKIESRGRKTINPDLKRERTNCTFFPIDVTYVLDGGPKKTAERRKIGKFLIDLKLGKLKNKGKPLFFLFIETVVQSLFLRITN